MTDCRRIDTRTDGGRPLVDNSESSLTSFGNAATGLAKNPLGVIALFLVLVYGLAALVLVFGGNLTFPERMPIIIFLIAFPLIVLAAFLWLVVRHNQRLYAPHDFTDEDNWVKMQLETVASIAAAQKSRVNQDALDVESLVQTVVRHASDRSSTSARLEQRSREILWVDDRHENNQYERRAFESQGFAIQLANNTEQALRILDENRPFAAIISDMGRAEGPQEGYVLLDAVRGKGIRTPFFIYASSRADKHRRETAARGGNGTTNLPEELFDMVMASIQ
jgi:CheY-like chemotaxis protein